MVTFEKIRPNQKGVIAIITLFGLSAFALAVITTLSSLALDELKMANAGNVIDRTFYSSEAGLNEGLYRLIKNPAPATYTFELDGVSISVVIKPNPDDPYQRIIESQASNSAGHVRTVEVIANTSSFAGGFDYAVQGGTGGVYLDNNSRVIGDVYSNGGIFPASGGATGNVEGTAWVANGFGIDKAVINGDVYANTITRSTIAGQAYYQTIDAVTTVGGSSCPNVNCFDDSVDPSHRDFPISDSDVQNWKDEITDAGNPVLTPDPATCPPSKSSGFYCVTSSGMLGLQKIDGNFYVGNGATLTLAGNIWITGNIILDNNGTIQLDPSLGPSSAVIIADGIIDVSNNYTISGSGHPASFALMLSINISENLTAPAIWASNNSDSIIFAALKGMLKVKQNGQLNAAAAKTLYLENNATVTYNPLIASFVIGAAGGEEIGTQLGSWHEK